MRMQLFNVQSKTVSGVYGGKDFRKSVEWKRVGVTASDSGDDGTGELRWLGWEDWEKEW